MVAIVGLVLSALFFLLSVALCRGVYQLRLRGHLAFMFSGLVGDLLVWSKLMVIAGCLSHIGEVLYYTVIGLAIVGFYLGQVFV